PGSGRSPPHPGSGAAVRQSRPGAAGGLIRPASVLLFPSSQARPRPSAQGSAAPSGGASAVLAPCPDGGPSPAPMFLRAPPRAGPPISPGSSMNSTLVFYFSNLLDEDS